MKLSRHQKLTGHDDEKDVPAPLGNGIPVFHPIMTE
jgi:hypothetical protein